MTTWYRGAGERQTDGSRMALPASPAQQHNRPEGYIADAGLIDAVNIALHLGQPLLLTGQPGTGKTQLAYSLAWELGFDEPLKFETKSTSIARDICYTYDALSHLQATQAGSKATTLDFIRWSAFGEAVLKANEPENVRDIYKPEGGHTEKQRSVVLIDEIDKAPRDFPNDLLNEVDGMYFRIPELDNRKVEADLRPVLILTSNSEKNLPEAFLRRCAFYHIPFPERDRLEQIVNRRLGERISDNPDLQREAFEIFELLRDPMSGLVKRPATSELLSWLHVLTANGAAATLTAPEQIEPALCVLTKLTEDRNKARTLIEGWQERNRS
ncbi:MAG: MoxR family ATPase [Woeseiaceae bacterium]|nr:MoxR family ATPase [Woeseiaceae bacterium]